MVLPRGAETSICELYLYFVIHAAPPVAQKVVTLVQSASLSPGRVLFAPLSPAKLSICARVSIASVRVRYPRGGA